MVLKPAKGSRGLKRFREVGEGFLSITKVNSQTGAVLGIARRRADLGPLAGGLIALRLDIKKDAFLKLVRAIPAEQSQINTVRSCGSLHGSQSIGSLEMQGETSRHLHQVVRRSFCVGEMPKQAAVLGGLIRYASHDWRRSGKPRQQRGAKQHGQQRSAEHNQTGGPQTGPTATGPLRWTRASCHRNVVPAGAAGGDGTNHSVVAVL